MPEPDRTLRARVVLPRTGGFALDVDVLAPPGITVLFGPSGSGKSTTLSAIAGLVRPASGRVTCGGEVWFDSAARVSVPTHRRAVAFVFQSLALFPHMTALENVAYGVSRELSSAERRARARAMLERMRAPHLADRKPPTFSGGEAQRVALARAFARSPSVVLLDEPFSALDQRLRHELTDDLRGFAADLGVPVVHVTHHRGEARALADRVVLIEHGRVVAVGDSKELLA